MGWDWAPFQEELTWALQTFDSRLAERLAEDLVEAIRRDGSVRAAPGPVLETVDRLIKRRLFDVGRRVADTAVQCGIDAPRLRLLLVQSLLDQRQLTAATCLLEGLARQADGARDRETWAEIQGLMGRCCKQAFVDNGGAKGPLADELLERALHAYRSAYDVDRGKVWHGINAVALLARGAADGLQAGDAEKARAIAREVMDTIGPDPASASVWRQATAAEACVALDEPIGVVLSWLQPYAASGVAEAFHLASTQRQFTEIWRLDPTTSPGAEIMTILRANLLKKEGGRTVLQGATPSLGQLPELQKQGQLQALLGNEGLVSLEWYLTGVARCQLVARVENGLGEGVGTGFLVRGSDLAPGLPGELLLLTNAHVVTDDVALAQSMNPPPLLPDRAFARFMGQAEGEPEWHTRVAGALWSSPPGELDASLLRLERPPAEVTPYPMTALLPRLDATPPSRVYIIGHPRGGGLKLSLNDNVLLDYESPGARIHYRAPTEPGSSGSPVFNAQWELLALHHAGGTEMPRLNGMPGTWPANEGLWIEKIKNALAAKFPS